MIRPNDKLYLLVGWSSKDGNVVSYIFSSAEKREAFYDTMEKEAKEDLVSEYFWIHNWYRIEKDLDPTTVQDTYDTE